MSTRKAFILCGFGARNGRMDGASIDTGAAVRMRIAAFRGEMGYVDCNELDGPWIYVFAQACFCFVVSRDARYHSLGRNL